MIPREQLLSKPFELRTRKAVYEQPPAAPAPEELDDLDLAYRTLCAALYNFVPTSGHPGGSISSGRIVESLLYETMDYDFSRPGEPAADQICYAAGHKALGLYAMWALRNELVRIARPGFLPSEPRQLRLEDLLGFRRNPAHPAPLFKKLKAKALDGHPTPAVPFVPLATGASGVGVGAGLGLALAAKDYYGARAPRVHLVEGEGGLTPGRVAEALAAAATMGLSNAVLHLDWNQASIDSDRVCAEGAAPGDYVQWDPRELFYLHGWNVLFVPEGFDFGLVLGAQRRALELGNGLPTAIVYRTTKGWRYGIEGRASHGAGHPYGSDGYRKAVRPFEERFNAALPPAQGDKTPEAVEAAYHATLLELRKALEARPGLAQAAASRIEAAARRLRLKAVRPRADAPKLERVYAGLLDPDKTPPEIKLKPGKVVSLRSALGDALGWLNRESGGAILGCAADLLDSTSVTDINAGFSKGFFHAERNPGSRLIAVGGICEDAMGALMAGVSSHGRHIGVTSSYSAFIAALEHVAARLHGIGQAARRAAGEPMRTWIMVNAHAGPKTGEDGPTHADPQGLQLLQNNFPEGICITLTPWEAQEVWPLVAAGLGRRPAVLCPFVTRPSEAVPDRAALGLPPASAAAKGVYAMRRSRKSRATVVLQGSAVASVFARDVLRKLDDLEAPVNVFYVASAELFDALSLSEQEEIFPRELRRHAIGITDFTWPTLSRWVLTSRGLRRSLHPFRNGTFLGSGGWERLLAEGGLDGPAQLEAILDWCRRLDAGK